MNCLASVESDQRVVRDNNLYNLAVFLPARAPSHTGSRYGRAPRLLIETFWVNKKILRLSAFGSRLSRSKNPIPWFPSVLVHIECQG
jgi:hypothetical protein